MGGRLLPGVAALEAGWGGVGRQAAVCLLQTGRQHLGSSPPPPLPACLPAHTSLHAAPLPSHLPAVPAVQVYAASIMFGYFLRRVDTRFQLAKQLDVLPPSRDDAVARLERLFAQVGLGG